LNATITKCKRFNSKYWCQNTEAVDSFTQNWFGENNWFVPPPIVICKVIRKFSYDKANGTLAVPNTALLHSLRYTSNLVYSCSKYKKYHSNLILNAAIVNFINFPKTPLFPLPGTMTECVFLLDSGATHSTVNSAFYSIKWVHDMCGQLDPTGNAFVKKFVESAKRTAKSPVVKKDPVSTDILISLWTKQIHVRKNIYICKTYVFH
jgi:hypothetical protein